jgi:hypothetical protein
MAQAQLQIHGERTSGQDVRTQNTTAVLAVANILKTSLGPVGLDKVSQITVTSYMHSAMCFLLFSIFLIMINHEMLLLVTFVFHLITDAC